MPSNSIAHRIPTSFDTTFQRSYAVDAPDLRGLYEKAKRDQWNASRDINWKTPLDLDKGIFANELVDGYGTDARAPRCQALRAPQCRVFMLATLAAAPWRGRRDARLQPVGRHGARQRREIFPVDPGR